MKREPKHIRIETRARLFKKQSGICVYCGKKIHGMPSLDHVVPVDLCTPEELEIMGENNLVVSHISCNKRKGNMIIFTNLFDKTIYPIVEIPYFFHHSFITYNQKDEKLRMFELGVEIGKGNDLKLSDHVKNLLTNKTLKNLFDKGVTFGKENK